MAQFESKNVDDEIEIYTAFITRAEGTVLRFRHCVFFFVFVGVALKVTVQFERCFRLMEHISVIS